MRTKPKPLAILIGDLHLREDQPEAWVESYWEAQVEALQFIRDLQRKCGKCPVLCPGDVFHEWKPSHALVAWAMEALPDPFVCVPGQHDLPQHNLTLFGKTALNVLLKGGRVRIPAGPGSLVLDDPSEPGRGENEPGRGVIWGFPWGAPIRGAPGSKGAIALVHRMVYPEGRPPYPDCPKEGTIGAVLRAMPGFDLILTGDNHEAFHRSSGSTLLVNPGSLLRMTAAQIDFHPRAYLWYGRDRFEIEYLPFDQSAVSRKHIDQKQERDERIKTFVKRLSKEVDIGLSFEKNLQEFMDRERTPKEVQSAVWEAVGT